MVGSRRNDVILEPVTEQHNCFVRSVTGGESRCSVRAYALAENTKTSASLYLGVTFVSELDTCLPRTTRGRHVLEYNTRGWDAYRSAQHRLQAYEALPSEVGAKLFNRLPLDLRVNRKPLFKKNVRRLLFFLRNAHHPVLKRPATVSETTRSDLFSSRQVVVQCPGFRPSAAAQTDGHGSTLCRLLGLTDTGRCKTNICPGPGSDLLSATWTDGHGSVQDEYLSVPWFRPSVGYFDRRTRVDTRRIFARVLVQTLCRLLGLTDTGRCKTNICPGPGSDLLSATWTDGHGSMQDEYLPVSWFRPLSATCGWGGGARRIFVRALTFCRLLGLTDTGRCKTNICPCPGSDPLSATWTDGRGWMKKIFVSILVQTLCLLLGLTVAGRYKTNIYPGPGSDLLSATWTDGHGSMQDEYLSVSWFRPSTLCLLLGLTVAGRYKTNIYPGPGSDLLSATWTDGHGSTFCRLLGLTDTGRCKTNICPCPGSDPLSATWTDGRGSMQEKYCSVSWFRPSAGYSVVVGADICGALTIPMLSLFRNRPCILTVHLLASIIMECSVDKASVHVLPYSVNIFLYVRFST
ncbi:hypothetical protein J6590_002952 [Homalodisca vitripennis]|nr:hypothetical protein J6590_002952 [Homalodisca vitripennis]